MHYDFKTKLNKIDSQQFRNLRIPEIDWMLNEAQELFVKKVAEPRGGNSPLGFETSQRTIDDIRTVVVPDYCSPVLNGTVTLPEDYWHYIGGSANISKGNCSNIKADLHIRQHDDEFESSSFAKSSFEWREINGVFNQNGIKIFLDPSFNVDEICINYIKTLNYIHFAEGFNNGSYRLPSGELLTGTSDCVLPKTVHREIVDIAVALASGNLQNPDVQAKMQKLNFNNLM